MRYHSPLFISEAGETSETQLKNMLTYILEQFPFCLTSFYVWCGKCGKIRVSRLLMIVASPCLTINAIRCGRTIMLQKQSERQLNKLPHLSHLPHHKIASLVMSFPLKEAIWI